MKVKRSSSGSGNEKKEVKSKRNSKEDTKQSLK
jgi:hypothetical protein